MSYTMENIARNLRDLEWTFRNVSGTMARNFDQISKIGGTLGDLLGEGQGTRIVATSSLFGVSIVCYVLAGSLITILVIENARQNGRRIKNGQTLFLLAFLWPILGVLYLIQVDKVVVAVEKEVDEDVRRILTRVDEIDAKMSDFIRRSRLVSLEDVKLRPNWGLTGTVPRRNTRNSLFVCPPGSEGVDDLVSTSEAMGGPIDDSGLFSAEKKK